MTAEKYRVDEAADSERRTPSVRPLVVDLDGTLIATDMSLENICWLSGHNFPALLQAPFWATRGRSFLKAKLADAGTPPVDRLPYNDDCLKLIATARNAGAKVILASATDERIVAAIAIHCGLFDEWYGSTPENNLSGARKAALLVDKFGHKGFDYVGDSRADIDVWRAANTAYSMAAKPGVRRALDAVHDKPTHIAASDAFLTRAHLKALRLHQWAKNLLIFVPVLASHQISAQNGFLALVAFLAFSLLASSVYLLNDLVDLPADRSHPRKSKRPFAAGTLPIRHGLVMAPLLFAASLALTLAFLPPLALAVLAAYYLGTLSYSFWLKQKVLIDIVVLAGLYTIRIIAGGVATGIESSPWLLAFSMFFFLSLAIVKRQAELVDVIKTNDMRTTKRGYRREDLFIVQSFGAASGYVSVLVLALYINSVAADLLYKTPSFLWLTCPLLLYWISRMLLLGARGQMHDDPIVFTIKDYVSYIIGLGVVAIVVASLLF